MQHKGTTGIVSDKIVTMDQPNLITIGAAEIKISDKNVPIVIRILSVFVVSIVQETSALLRICTTFHKIVSPPQCKAPV